MTTGLTTERAPYPAAGQPERERLLARLADRAKFIRLETVRLAEIPGAGHYTGTFSAAELLASLYYPPARCRAAGRLHLRAGHPAARGQRPHHHRDRLPGARQPGRGRRPGRHRDQRPGRRPAHHPPARHGRDPRGRPRDRGGAPAALYAHYQLDGAGVEAVARALLAR